ncbi:MAG: prepilin-type N-terminal cleavage/methylation domain-containing protein [Colwellia sp.]|nr:prepilin-type N-terminal cleavage/methylation domain-containing protein [Colwellia sp.]
MTSPTKLKTMQLRGMPCRQLYTTSRGFSLIELIIVIVILGVLSVGISSFIGFGTQVYTDATARDQVVSSARFAIERLNRELRNALPNSMCLTNTSNGPCVEDASQCLKFTPIIEAATYLDIPVVPDEASNSIKLIKFTEDTFDPTGWSAIVYPLRPADVYGLSGKVFPVSDIVDDIGNDWEIELENERQFAEHSPTQRIFFIKGAVSYCLTGGELRREGVLMAEDITNANPFTIKNSSLQRNAIVQVYLKFDKSNESIVFNNEIQVPNVP